MNCPGVDFNCAACKNLTINRPLFDFEAIDPLPGLPTELPSGRSDYQSSLPGVRKSPPPAGRLEGPQGQVQVVFDRLPGSPRTGRGRRPLEPPAPAAAGGTGLRPAYDL